MKFAVAAVAAVGLSGCVTGYGSDRNTLANGTFIDTMGRSVGTVRLAQAPSGGLWLTADVRMAPGTYGIHVHQVGRCERPGFTSAGAHWNPTTRQHGRLNPQGSHHGDLPNLVVGGDGRGQLSSALVGSVSGFDGVLDADGAAVVIHARPDDERTDPAGNSGDRIACAVLTRR